MAIEPNKTNLEKVNQNSNISNFKTSSSKSEKATRISSAEIISMAESTYPLLVSYLLHLRRINSVQNRMDDLNRTAQFIKEFNYMCKHNLIFYLTVTHQFAELQNLFQSKKRFARLWMLLKAIKKEAGKQIFKQYELQEMQLAAKRLEFLRAAQAPQKSIAYFEIPPLVICNYYQERIYQLKINYHFKSSALYINAMKRGVNELDHIVNNLRTVLPESLEKEQFLKEVGTLKTEINEKFLIWENHSKTPAETMGHAEKLHHSAKECFDASIKIKYLLEKYLHLNPTLFKTLINREEKRILTTMKQARLIEKEYSESTKELMQHYQYQKEMIIESASINLDGMIKILKSLDKSDERLNICISNLSQSLLILESNPDDEKLLKALEESVTAVDNIKYSILKHDNNKIIFDHIILLQSKVRSLYLSKENLNQVSKNENLETFFNNKSSKNLTNSYKQQIQNHRDLNLENIDFDLSNNNTERSDFYRLVNYLQCDLKLNSEYDSDKVTDLIDKLDDLILNDSISDEEFTKETKKLLLNCSDDFIRDNKNFKNLIKRIDNCLVQDYSPKI